MTRVLIPNLEISNLASVKNMLKKLNVECLVTKTPPNNKNFSKIIFPGIGSFDTIMNKCNNLNWTKFLIDECTINKTPILGICLGMQILCQESEEGREKGLGLIRAKVKKFKAYQNIKIPHMGWNTVEVINKRSIFKDDYYRFYFVHSYYVECLDKKDVLTTSIHGQKFTSSFNNGNIYGVQFHPEKSHSYGLKLLSSFLEV